MKIGIDVLIPKNLTSLMIGMKGENIKKIQDSSRSSIHFNKNENKNIKLMEGCNARR